MKKVILLFIIILLAGYGCSNSQQGIVEQQQKQIDELTKKFQGLSKSETSNSNPTIQTKIVERIVKDESNNSSKELEELRKKIEEIESTTKENLSIVGTSKIAYQQFIPYIVKIICLDGSGSGTIISPNTILTNYHVVAGSNQCYVKFTTDITRPSTEKMIGTISSIDSVRDRAIITVNSPYANLTIKKCNALDTKVTDELTIMGYPTAGGDTLTITNGIISGFEKHFIKTSAKINPGNSGGAAIHESGCYLGLPTSANVEGIEPLGHIVDERIGGNINDNDTGLLSTNNTTPENGLQSETKQYLENKVKYDFFVTESKVVWDKCVNSYNKISEVLDAILEGQYGLTQTLTQSLYSDYDNIIMNHLDNISPIENIKSIQSFKDNTRALLSMLKGPVVYDLEQIENAILNKNYQQKNEYVDKLFKKDLPKVDDYFTLIKTLRSDAIEQGKYHYYR